MPKPYVAVISILLCCQLAGIAAADRKGKLIKTSTTRVYRNAEGQLANGASAEKSEDKSSVLMIDDRDEGSLLSIRINGVPHYLAFPLDKNASSNPILVTEPGPTCNWNRIRILAGKSLSSTLLEKDYYEVPEGAYKNFQLSCDENNLLVLAFRKPSKPNTSPVRPPHVGRILEYVNLDQGK